MATQKQSPLTLGFLPTTPANGPTTLALSAAATWLAFSFVPDANRQVSKVRFFTSAVGGTLGANDLTCDLFSDSAGAPSASIESRNTVTATPAGAATVEFTGFTATSSVTAGTPYWLVLKNVNGVPATNFPTYRWGGSDTWPRAVGSAVGYGWAKAHSTNSGGAWGTTQGANCGWRIEYADGTFQGGPVSNMAISADHVYAARELGIQLTSPANATLNVRGMLLFQRQKTGTPTGGLRGRLYTGASPSILATTAIIPQADVTANSLWFAALFAATQAIQPSTVLTLTMGEDTNSDALTSRYDGLEYTIDNDANSKALLPWGMQKAYFDGSTWTLTDTALVPIGLILDTDGEFAAQAAGGLLTHPGMAGRMVA